MNGSVATGGKLDCLSGSNAGSAGGTACANGTAALGTCNVGAQPANNMGCKAGAGVIGN